MAFISFVLSREGCESDAVHHRRTLDPVQSGAEADRRFLKKTFGLPSVDAGGGWRIFGLPPSELAVHPSSRNNHSEFYFMCADLKALTNELKKEGIRCSPIHDRAWGLLSSIWLPGGGKLPVYQPKHPSPKAARPARKRSTKP